MFKKRKIYKDIHLLPLKNWVLVNEKNDLGYLYENYQKPNKKNNLEKIFESLQYQVFDVIGVDLKMITSWSNFISDYLFYMNNLNINKVQNSINLKSKDLIKNGKQNKIKAVRNPSANYNKSFSEYLNVLSEYYTDFEVVQYSLISDFENKFIEFYGLDYLPKEVSNVLTYHFFSIHEFYGNLNKIKDLDVKRIFTSKIFLKKFIEFDIIKIKDLHEYHISLQKSYQKNESLPQFMVDKRTIFDLQNLKKTPRNTTTISDEIAVVSRILKHQINTSEMTVSEFYHTIKQIEKEPKPQPENPQPQAS